MSVCAGATVIESPEYLHLEKSGEGLSVTWKLSERQLREKRVERNRLSDDAAFVNPVAETTLKWRS